MTEKLSDAAAMLLCLQRFCARHNLRVPVEVELKFDTKTDALQFEDAMNLYREENGAPKLAGRRIETIMGVPISLSFPGGRV